MKNVRALLPTTLVMAGGLLVACPSTPADPARIGDSCEGVSARYTCALDRTAILSCDGANLWRTEVLCEDTCEYLDDETYGALPCCQVDGEQACYDDNGRVATADDSAG